jgi:hypothetical protein
MGFLFCFVKAKVLCLFKYLNNESSKQIVDEVKNSFTNLKSVSLEYEAITRQLERHLPSVPPGQMGSDENERRTIQAWKLYISWEKHNPLELESGSEMLMKRVMYAYEQAFICLAYHCDIWHEAACYLQEQAKNLPDSLSENSYNKEYVLNAAAELYERAIASTMKDTPLVYLAYADFEEVGLYSTIVNEIF